MPARSRAFALKPAFTLDLYEQLVRSTPEESLVANQATTASSDFEEQLLRRFRKYEGRTVEDVAREFGVPPSNAKSYAAAVVRRAFGAKSFRSRIREFDEMGLTPRMSRVNADLMPYEATVVSSVPVQGATGGDLGGQRPALAGGVYARSSQSWANEGAPRRPSAGSASPSSGAPAPSDWRRFDRSGSCTAWRSARGEPQH